MDKKILWSWNSSEPDTDNIQLPLSITFEKVVSVVFLTIILGIFLAYISPTLGTWSYYLFILAYLVLIPYTLKNYKSKKKLKENEHISISKDEIKVNYYGYLGSYPINNIDMSSIEVKYILVSRGGHIGYTKGLCFKTITPAMKVKIPLPLAQPGLLKLNETINVLKMYNETRDLVN